MENRGTVRTSPSWTVKFSDVKEPKCKSSEQGSPFESAAANFDSSFVSRVRASRFDRTESEGIR